MKFFHLSDLHIGLRLYNRDLKEDQACIFDQIISYAREEQPDAVLIAGDIYDKAIPSADAVETFDRFVSGLTDAVPEAEIMMISGNHDSGPRLNLFRPVLRRQRIHMIGLPPVRPEDHIEKVVLTDAFGPVCFYLLPFVRPSMVREILGAEDEVHSLTYDETLHRLIEREEIDPENRNVLVSHQFYIPAGEDAAVIPRMDSEIVTVGNIDAVRADILQRFDYAALGHIHKPMQAGGTAWRYCGTPMACSVSEAGQEKSIVVVEMAEKGSLQIRSLPLIPLRRIRKLRGLLQEVLTEAGDDYVSVTLTDPEDLEVIDMQDRLRHAFPNLLEIRRETTLQKAEQEISRPERELDPMELCRAFLGELKPEEELLLSDVWNTIQERQPDRT